MLRAVIFDMDGTLLDSEVIHFIVIREILKRELGFEMDVDEYLKYCGIPDQKMWPMILEEMETAAFMPALARLKGSRPNLFAEDGTDDSGSAGTDEQKNMEGPARVDCPSAVAELKNGEDRTNDMGSAESAEQKHAEEQACSEESVGTAEARQKAIADLSAAFEKMHWEEYDIYIEEHGVECFPGVKELLESLKKEGFRLAVATGSLVRVVSKNLDLLGIKDLIDATATSEDCENGKPDPDVFLMAAERLGIEPADCLVVEDAGNGLIAAGRAGMARVGFDGAQMPSDMTEAPFVFSDYRKVRPADFYAWYETQ